MKNYEKIGTLAKKAFYGKVRDIGFIKGIGYIPNDEYFIDEHTYLFGFKIKTKRYFDEDEFKNKKKKLDRVVVKGFTIKKGVE